MGNHTVPAHPQLWPDRLGAEHLPGDDRFADPEGTGKRPMPIGTALREYCHIPGTMYLVMAFSNDGQPPSVLSSPRLPSQVDVERYVNVEALAREVNLLQSGEYEQLWHLESSVVVGAEQGPSGANMAHDEQGNILGSSRGRYPREAGRRWPQDRRYRLPMESSGLGNNDGNSESRRRTRASTAQRASDKADTLPPATIASSKRPIQISNEEQLLAFYDQRFKNCQQNACKMIAKAWVKTVEPKKQSTHPYTGPNANPPHWWPWNGETRLRHREPDHLYKWERCILLNHILKMIIEPNHKQPPSIQRLQLNVATLEEVTMEALSAFFADRESPSNAMKKPYLKEIFRVAKREEGYKNGELDPATLVYVTSEDRVRDGYMSNEDEDEEMEDLRGEDEEDPILTPASSAQSPPRQPSHPMVQQTQGMGQDTPGQFPGEAFAEDLPMRGVQYTAHPVPGSGLGPERHGFTDGLPPLSSYGHLGLQPMNTSPHDSNRRSPMFNPSSEYGSPATPTMYTQWPGSAAPHNSSMYAFPPTAEAHPPFAGQPGIPLPQSQQYMVTPFESMARGGHDAHHGGMFRPGELPQNALAHQSAYGGFVGHDPGVVKSESENRHPAPQ
ncbi:hypothetical protein F4780DRAFT_486666 [Xylariomycetidae sp. FL0641]|nr:hypothetical protein F4780DRAFT_486666 [Xylariomycetidae sp. FL0641]